MRNEKITSHDRLIHILDAIEKIKNFTKGLSRNEFLNSDLVNGACLYQFLIIGEAITRVGNVYLDRYPYPWYQVRAFRNLIAHEYFGTKLTAVWDIIEMDLPNLENVISNILKIEF